MALLKVCISALAGGMCLSLSLLRGAPQPHTQHVGTNRQCDKHRTQRTEHPAQVKDTQVQNARYTH